MANATEPQSDREWLIKLSSQVERLSQAIEGFAKTLEEFEEKKLNELEKKVKELEKWQNEWSGVYKFLLIGLTILTIFSIIIRYT